MDDAQIAEAAGAVQVSTGASGYLHGIGYSLEKFISELECVGGFMKNKTKVKAGAK